MQKNAIIFIFSISCLICLTSCEYKAKKGPPKSFLSYDYYDEWKRIPLVFPFEINDFYGNTEISRWEYYKHPPRSSADEKSPMQITKIHRFAVTNGYLFGEHDTGCVWPSNELEYFVFSLTQTNVIRFSDKIEFVRYCATFGGDIKQLRPFEEQWKLYWGQHGKQ